MSDTAKTTAITAHIETGMGGPAGKLAEASIHFHGGALDGMKLIGFTVWERRDGTRNVTFPARQYTANGDRRSFALLRPAVVAMHGYVDPSEPIRDLILNAYEQHVDQAVQS